MNAILDEARPQVPALAAITRPLGMTKLAEARCYICTVQSASTHRRDGKKLPFVHGFMRTDIKQDIEHMEHEIEEGNQYFRHATALEIEEYDMRTDPRGTLRKNITLELEDKIRAEVTADMEATMRAELELKIRTEMQQASGAKPAGIKPDASPKSEAQEQKLPEVTDAEKLAGSDRLSQLKASRQDVAGATLTHGKPAFTPVSTTDIGAGAALSGK